ncbi:heavy metal translocating P-type ATPase [Coraliomargarita sinensis]|uniref:Heavy metal translocating P-type ATPase n=1 Tax=Coraliomargarita sinensis TaxID=2174842 RepID=A0A317ZDB0_9BACT|nr:heavy metal translocating P-type ATPase [Coraliomargarita sinensis]PXA03010.1 heavy metal translocating P-type ATPase [Coraliomargarita sinensis]
MSEITNRDAPFCLQEDCPRYEECPRRKARGCRNCPIEVTSGRVRRVLQWSTLSSERKELILMVVAAVTLAAGGLANSLGWNGVAIVAYTLTYLSGGWYGALNGLQSLRERKLDVDLLMVLAALGAAVVGAPFEGGMLLFLFSLSNVLQNHALSRSRSAIRSLMKLRPTEVRCEVDGETRMIGLDDVTVGTVVRLRPGDRVALDGEVLEGESSIDESSLSGESMPVFKTEGNDIFAGTINQHGSLSYRVTKPAGQSTLDRIITLVEEAQEEKAQTQRFLERAEGYYAGFVILFTLGLILVPPLFWAAEFSSSFYRAMTILVVASPCALVISTPAAFWAAIAGAARRGVLFKGGVHLEQLASVDTVALDKTGTLTTGQPVVTNVFLNSTSISPDRGRQQTNWKLLQMAASVEAHSEHPIARAIEKSAMDEGCDLQPIEGFQSHPGKGAEASVAGARILVGSPSLFRDRGGVLNDKQRAAIDELLSEGKTVVLVAEIAPDGPLHRLLGWIAVADQIREDATAMVGQLRRLGIRRIVMLTGDNTRVAQQVARQAGIDEVAAELLPEAKLEKIKELSEQGVVAMVGDGVNDVPALARAHVGIAMGAAGTDVAMETADVVLMSSRLSHLVHAFALARKSRVVVTQNLSFALGVILVLASVALFGHMPLPLGVVGHEGSTVLVCLNGLRLLGFKTN